MPEALEVIENILEARMIAAVAAGREQEVRSFVSLPGKPRLAWPR